MKHHNDITSLVFNGEAEPGFWSTAYFDPERTISNDSISSFALVLSLKGDSDFDADRAGGLLIEHIQEKYFELLPSGDILNALEKSLSAGIDHLSSLLERENSSAKGGIDFDVAAISIVDGRYIYFANFGNGFILLKRNDKFINITDSLKTRANRYIRVGSGLIEYEDVFIVATPNSTVTIPEEIIRDSIDTFTFENIKDKHKYPGCSIVLTTKRTKTKTDKPIVNDEIKHFENNDIPVHIESKDTSNVVEGDFIPETTEVVEKNEGIADKSKIFFEKVKQNIKGLASEDRKKTYQNILSQVNAGINKAIQFLHFTVWDKWLGFGKDKVFLRSAGSKFNWKGIIIVAVFLILVIYLLWLSISSISKKNEENASKVEVQKIFSEIDSLINDTQVARSQGNLVKARENLNKINTLVSEVEEKKVMTDELNSKKSELQSLKNQVNKVVQLNNNSIITDLSAFFENVNPSDMELVSGSLIISDADSSIIYKVSLDGKNVEEIFNRSNGIDKPVSLTTDDSGQLIMMDKSNGIFVGNVDEKTIQPIAGLSTISVGDVKALASFKDPFANNYIYYLVPSKKAINRSTVNGSNFSFPMIRYENELFAQAKDLEVDGAYGKVYALINDQPGIIRYAGEIDRYEIFGLPVNEQNQVIKLSDSTSIEVTLDYLAFADPVAKSVILLTKFTDSNNNAGNFVGQFKLDGSFDKLVEMTVDEDSKSLYILDGTKIIKAELSKISDL